MTRATMLPEPPAAIERTATPTPEPRAATPVIRVDRLRKAYGSTVAVDNVSLEIESGLIFGMVGPNGAGKTTTIECIEGQRRPDSGTIQVLGEDPYRGSTSLRRIIGIQLQEASLPLRIKAWEAVDLFAAFHGVRVDYRAHLAAVGLDDKADCEFHKLSGGQKQRLFVALALVNKPELVFLDELTTGLDPHARQQMWELVRRIRAEGRTIVMTTHSMAEAEALCDRVAIFNRGRIVALDSPLGLIRGSGLESHLTFSTSGSIELQVLEAIPGVKHVHRAGDLVSIEAPAAVLSALIRTLDEHGWTYRDLRSVEPTLEDVFLALTGPNAQGE